MNAMEIGKKLKEARIVSGHTQEEIAEEIQVSRQTISNWENEKCYPDIISVIALSDVYGISLDELLKGDEHMIAHLKEDTNVVSSNKKLYMAVLLNVAVILVMLTCSAFFPNHILGFVGVFILAILSSSFLLYQIIRKL